MKRTDRMILLVLPLAALVIGFYLLAISPKRDEIAALDEEIATLEDSVATAESEIAIAEEARRRFSENYADVVSLGAAVPDDSDQATFIYDLNELGGRNSVKFRSFEVTAAGAEAAAPAAPAATTTPPEGGEGEGDSAPAEEAPATPVAATPTEATAATLPIGSTVGPAGLPLMPYKLKFNGSFFDMADFLADLDDSVTAVKQVEDDDGPDARGRLVTVNGFSMIGDPTHGFPLVQAGLAVTTYVVPPAQGVVGGASPAGPAPVTAAPGDAATPAGTQTAMVR